MGVIDSVGRLHLERYLRLLNPVVDLLPKWIILGQVLLSVPNRLLCLRSIIHVFEIRPQVP